MFLLRDFFLLFLSAQFLTVSISVIHFIITNYNETFRLLNIFTLSEISVTLTKNGGSMIYFAVLIYSFSVLSTETLAAKIG
jgi:hypothetical protein